MDKLSDKEWVELTKSVVEHRLEGLRLGQSYMNALHIIKPKLYEEMSGTKYDCFYSDENIVNFLNYLDGDVESENI